MFGLIILFVFLFLVTYAWEVDRDRKKAKEDAWRKEVLEAIRNTHKKPAPLPKPYLPDDDPYWQPDSIPKTPKSPAGSTGAAVVVPVANSNSR